MKKSIKNYKGFTLIESLVAIVILGGFTYMIMATFNSIQIKNIQENSRTEIQNYSTRTLDTIAEYVMNSISGVTTTGVNGDFPTYRLQVISKDFEGNPILINDEYVIETVELRCSQNTGILINGKYPNQNFFNEDPNALTSYKIKEFKIEKITLPNNIALPPTIINDMNEASYNITLEVDIIYNQNEELIRTLTFNRTVFTPNTFIAGAPDV